MNDRLDEFIQNNREAFDMFEPSPDVWDKIQKKEPDKKIRKLNWKGVLWKAASVIVIFLLTFTWQEYRHSNMGNSGIASEQTQVMPPELVEAQMYYASQVNEKMVEVRKLSQTYPDIEKDIKQDFLELDSIYLELKNDLKDDVSNEEVVNAMIQNYRIKVQILEDLLFQMQKFNDKKSANPKKDEIRKYDI